nr:BatD family protein [Candidatus Electrothrix aestuarii]
MRILLFFIVLSCFFSAFSAVTTLAADVQVTAEINPTSFSEDQAASFVLTVSGARSAEPEMPRTEGLHIVYQGQSSQTSWVNGEVSSAISYNFLVQAEKPGKFTIPPVNVTIKGETYTTESVQCTVLPTQNAGGQIRGNSGGARGSSSGANPNIVEIKDIGFMRIVPETKRMYSGQVVPFILKAYFRAGQRVTLKSAPRLSGEDFLLQSLDEEPIQQQEHVKGKLYTSLTWKGTLSAVKEGSFPLTVEMDAEVLVRSRSRLRGSPFGSSLLDDPFFADILGNYSRRNITVSSPENTVTVLDLPTENRPADFSGAIGTFSLNVAASPLDGKIGDPITMKMQLDGSGNFALVQAPTLSDEQGWKTYPASGSVKDLGGGKGEKTFEQALIPTDQSLNSIPPVRFSYFDPKIEEYVTLNSDPIFLHLQKADNVSAAPVDAQSTPQAKAPLSAGQEGQKNLESANKLHLASLKPDLGRLVPSIEPLYHKLSFVLLLGIALLLILLSLLFFLRQRRLAKDPSILRRREVQGRLATHYEGMKKALASQSQKDFLQHCRAAIQQGTGQAWGLSPEAVTLADLEQRLPVEDPLRAIFVRLEQSEYAGEQLPQADLEKMLQTTRKELGKLV